MSLVHFYETEPNINLSMIFDHASAARLKSLDFSYVSVSQEPPGARAQAYRHQCKLEQNGPAMMDHLSPAARFVDLLRLHKVNGGPESICATRCMRPGVGRFGIR